MTIEVLELHVYPLKSCRGIALREMTLTPQGPAHDRQWMVIGDTGRPVTQREIPHLSQIETALQDEVLVLSHPDHGQVELPMEAAALSAGELIHTRLWKDECAIVEASEDASSWLTRAVGSSKPLRIVRMAPGYTRPQSHPDELGKETHVQFADAGPYLVIDVASLDRVNQALVEKGEAAVPMNRFRPNIVVRGMAAFGEHRQARLGTKDYCFFFRMPCERCVIPTIDQSTSVPHPTKEPFATLRDLNPREPKRRQPLFGQYATLEAGEGESIAIGDIWPG